MGTQTTDIFALTGAAITYTSPTETWTINAGISVASAENYAVLSAQIESTLINNGSIFGRTAGVWFQGSSGAITNNGEIASMVNGILVSGGSSTVVNHGSVRAFTNKGVVFDSTSDGDMTNDGEIFGHDSGVWFHAVTGDMSVQNSGLIHSDQVGILHERDFDGTNDHTLTIDNNLGGRIEGFGSDDAISTDSDGNVLLNNFGTIIGAVDFAGLSADQVINRGVIQGVISLGAGSDTFIGTRGISGAVFGGEGNDKLTGGSRRDVLVGELGTDLLRGAAGADKFTFNAVLDSVVGAFHDSIVDFSHKQRDKIDLHNIDANTTIGGDQAFHFIGAKPFHGVAGELRYSQRLLRGDVDGDGAPDFEISVNAKQLAQSDFIL
jgi:hypothetical protein